MGIGSGIFLFIAGAIIAFALKFNIAFVDQRLIGFLLMGGGVIVFIISLFATFKQRSTTTTSHTDVNPSLGERDTTTQTRTDNL